MNAGDSDLKRDIDAAIGTRKELGPEYETALVESFLEKMEERFDSVVDKRVRRQLAEQQMVVARGDTRPRRTQQHSSGLPDGLGARLGLAVVSLVLAVPLSAIAVANAGLAGLLTCWGGIVAVNAVQASRSWFPPPKDRRKDLGDDGS
ncbi:hypothetical protein [Streptomyces sulphureus]|uniref:hypothetical protein n=1 Tax=Streptomyces sulphureus TaxID=47758 RepID=UPI00036F9FD1|nr:hypothetical protein [Streptomyces sulphureus]